jgi:hypothetical protein
MSTPAAPANPNRKLFIGAGIGCGCLTLIIAIVALVLILGALGRSQSQAPGPQPQPVQPQPPQPQPPQPQPPQPQPPQPQPPQQPSQSEGIDGFKVQVSMVKVLGDGDNAKPGAPTDTYSQGETVGAFGIFAEVRGTHEIHVIFLKVEGEKPTLVSKPIVWTVSEQLQGKTLWVRLGGAIPGEYVFGILKSTGPEQFQRIAIRRFRVQ